MKIKCSLAPSSIDAAIKQLEDYSKDLERKAQEICKRLADMGALYAEWNFSGVLYAGDIDYHITVDRLDENTYVIKADGESVLLMEFGAGVKHGYGHPQADEFGMGPGTYPNGKGHWNDPKGWWFGEKGHWTHTYGNAPGMPMYNAAKDLRKEIMNVAREVFSHN